MNWKTPLILIVLAAVSVIGVVAMRHRSQPANDSNHPAKLVPDLEQKVNDVTGVRIRTAGNHLVADLKRTNAGWVVANKHDYPANLGQLRELLLNIAQAHVLETKTADPKRYPKLAVAAVSHNDAKGVEVAIDGLTKPLKLIVGKAAPDSSNETYVRLTDQTHSLLVDVKLDASKKTTNWLRQPLLNLPSEQVQKVVIRHPDGSSLTVARKDRTQNDLVPADLPPGRELKYPTAADPIATVVTNLQLQDVVPVSQLDPAKQKNAVTARYTLFSGLTVSFTAFKHAGHDYVQAQAGFDQAEHHRFAASVKPTQQKSSATNAADKNQAKDAQAKPKDKHSAEAVDAHAKALNQRFKGWVYQIPGYKYDNLTKTLDDLLKPVKKTTAPKPSASHKQTGSPLNPQKPASSSQAPAPSGQ